MSRRWFSMFLCPVTCSKQINLMSIGKLLKTCQLVNMGNIAALFLLTRKTSVLWLVRCWSSKQSTGFEVFGGDSQGNLESVLMLLSRTLV